MQPTRIDDGTAASPSARPQRHDRCERWLAWFAVAVIVGLQAGTIFRPLGSLGETRVADWIDLATPFAVVGSAAMVIQHAGAPRPSWTWLLVGGVAFALGHGLHLAANSISNVDDRVVAEASIVHLWDEVASHYVWYVGLYLVMVALWTALLTRELRVGPIGIALAVLVAITLANSYLEGGVPWLGLGLLASGAVAGATRRRTSIGRLAVVVGVVGLVELVVWGLAWYLVDGRVFPQFTEVGWI